MFTLIPVNEMAETLRTLAGVNAANAARHFSARSYDLGDVASAVLWSSIARTIEGPARAAIETTEAAPDPMPMARIREGLAFQGVWYEDVDPEVLAREEPPQTVVAAVDEWTGNPARHHGFAPTEEARTFGRSARRRLIRPDIELSEAA